MLEAGAKLPDIAANDDGGVRFALTSLRGKPFVVWFYPKADTPG
jgi:peroxiredoxin Q/BCP